MSALTPQQYDLMYAAKPYEREAHLLRERLWRLDPSLHTVLDVACGTGRHDEHLCRFYEVDGLDLNEAYLEVARQRNPRGRYHEADMRDFRLDRLYDAVLCLFSAIGYARTRADLVRSLTCMRDHLTPRGVVVVEPWLTPAVFQAPSLRWEHGEARGEAGDHHILRLARVLRRDAQEGAVSVLEFHYLIGTCQDVEHQCETHELGLFTEAQMLSAFAAAGLGDVVYEDDGGLTGRGLYVARVGS